VLQILLPLLSTQYGQSYHLSILLQTKKF
jgi:hypothetical protein